MVSDTEIIRHKLDPQMIKDMVSQVNVMCSKILNEIVIFTKQIKLNKENPRGDNTDKVYREIRKKTIKILSNSLDALEKARSKLQEVL